MLVNKQHDVGLLRLGLHRISYLAPAEIRPYFPAGYEAGFDHILNFEFFDTSALLSNFA